MTEEEEKIYCLQDACRHLNEACAAFNSLNYYDTDIIRHMLSIEHIQVWINEEIAKTNHALSDE